MAIFQLVYTYVILVAFSDSIWSANFRKSEEFLKFGDQFNFSEATFINTANNIRANYGHFGVLPIVSKFLTPMTLRLGNGHWRKRDLLAITIRYQLSRCFEKSPIVANNWCTYHHWREPLIVVTFLPQYLHIAYQAVHRNTYILYIAWAKFRSAGRDNKCCKVSISVSSCSQSQL